MPDRITTLKPLLLLALLLAPIPSLAQQTPVGRWRTFDDKTGQERGLMVIEDHGGTLTGRIGGILDPVEAARVCENCKDARHGQPVLGMTVMTGMRQDGDKWDGGVILDPETGSSYHCTMQLQDGGAKLTRHFCSTRPDGTCRIGSLCQPTSPSCRYVRGYIGISLFGRSQTWLRQGS